MQHEAIQGTIRAKDSDIISEKIQLGNIYDISNFFVTQNKPTYKTVPHIAMLQFARATSFTLITEEPPPIPFHKFYFTEFDQLQQRVNTIEILSGKTNNLP